MPGNNPGMLMNAGILGADAIILDLEDAVSLTEKDSARNLVCEAIEYMNYKDVEVVVRINPTDTEYFIKDIKAIAKVKPDTIMVPKASVSSIEEASRALDELEKEMGLTENSIGLIPLIETAYGLETVFNIINSSKRVNGILLGGEDLTADLAIKRTKEGKEIFYARNRVATACKAARIDAIDTPFTDTNDYEGLKKDTENAKSLGLTGKSSINPRQIDTIHEVFAPSKEDIQKSLRIMEAMEKAKAEGKGVFSLDGKMVDAPILNRAKATVELARMLRIIE